MKKAKYLLSVLLILAMLLSLTVTASANMDVDPNECPFCGIGSVVTTFVPDIGAAVPTGRTKSCTAGGKMHTDVEMTQLAHNVTQCNYEPCSHLFSVEDASYTYWLCDYYHPGMRLGDELS